MNVNQLRIKFQELKGNLTNPRTQTVLLEEKLDLNKLIDSIDNYLENIEQIQNEDLLKVLVTKLDRSIYITNNGVRSYLDEFINIINFFIGSQPKKVNDNYIENIESKINEEEFSLRYDKLIEFLNFDTEESNLILETSSEKKPFRVYKTKTNSLSFYAASSEKRMLISKEKLINIYLEKEEPKLVYAKVIIDKIKDNSIFDFFVKKDSSDLIEVFKNKLLKNENDILVLKNNLENLQKENQSLENTKIKLDEIIDKSKIAQDEYTFAKNAAIDDAKLKKSLKYWEIKQKRHNKKFWIFMVLAVILICSLIGFLYYEINSHKNEKKELTSITPISSNISDKSKDNLNNKSEEKEQKKVPNELKVQKEGKDNKSLQIDVNVQIENLTKYEELNKESKETLEKKDESFIKDLENSNLPLYFLIIFATSSIFWIIRIIVKIALSNLHLSEDAHERVVMIYTYLSFVQKGQLDDEKEDKKLILSSLFRPSNIGIIQDESSVTVTDIITAFKK
jgi:hypothetical protein